MDILSVILYLKLTITRYRIYNIFHLKYSITVKKTYYKKLDLVNFLQKKTRGDVYKHESSHFFSFRSFFNFRSFFFYKMDKYKVYYYIMWFLIIKFVFGNSNDLEIKERTWKEELTGNIAILLRV